MPSPASVCFDAIMQRNCMNLKTVLDDLKCAGENGPDSNTTGDSALSSSSSSSLTRCTSEASVSTSFSVVSENESSSSPSSSPSSPTFWLEETDYLHGNTLLIVAAQRGWKKAVKLLLRRGARLDATNKYGNTALHFAVEFGQGDVEQLLRKKGARCDIANIKGNMCGRQPLV
jgi:hypothetical protein